MESNDEKYLHCVTCAQRGVRQRLDVAVAPGGHLRIGCLTCGRDVLRCDNARVAEALVAMAGGPCAACEDQHDMGRDQ